MPDMYPKRIDLTVDLDAAHDATALRSLVAKKLGVAPSELPEVVVRKRSIDARGRKVRFALNVEVGAPPDAPMGGALPRETNGTPRVIVVGDGPAGLFCAYELARAGVSSLVLDRGKKVQPRRRDLKALNQDGVIPEDSNYCFGEGGAGTYSDGKLYTRADKRGDVRDVIETLALHGAPSRILVDARPHIGSNLLPKVITAMRERLEAVGVQFRFEARVTGVSRDPSGRVRGVHLEGEEIGADAVVLATGHSARDVWRFLDDAGVRLEPKPFALGVRIEHPQPLINRIQYGRHAGHPKLPAAYYKLTTHAGDRAVFSFCMCPGGWIVPASTEAGGLVVNGMSLKRRDSPYANSGLVVSIEPERWQAAGFDGPLGGVALQRRIEEAAFVAGGSSLVAPATRVTDFLAGRGSSTVPASSYIPGLNATDVSDVLDAADVGLSAALREGLAQLGKKMPGYTTEEAVLVGVESRTSAPVRVPRDPETLECVGLPALYPTGEGAGYAGGIVSAALDGIRVAREVTRRLVPAGKISQASA